MAYESNLRMNVEQVFSIQIHSVSFTRSYIGILLLHCILTSHQYKILKRYLEETFLDHIAVSEIVVMIVDSGLVYVASALEYESSRKNPSGEGTLSCLKNNTIHRIIS